MVFLCMQPLHPPAIAAACPASKANPGLEGEADIQHKNDTTSNAFRPSKAKNAGYSNPG